MDGDQATWAPGLWITDKGAVDQEDSPRSKVLDNIPVHGASFSAYVGEAGVEAFGKAWSAAAAKMKPSSQGPNRGRTPSPPTPTCRAQRRHTEDMPEPIEAVVGSWNLDADRWPSEYWPCGGDLIEATNCTNGWCNAWPAGYIPDCIEQQEFEEIDSWSEAAVLAGLIPGTEWPDLWLCDGDKWLDPASTSDCWSPEQWEAFGNEQWSASRRSGKRGVAANANLIPRSRSHNLVPRRVDLQSQYKQHRDSGQEVTTMMIRNVPNRYTRQNLMEELNDAGFEGKYDFVYIPVDNATKWNVGYAFINFENNADCNECMQVFDGREFKRESRPKTNAEARRRRLAQVAVAHLQGLQANLEHIIGKTIFFSSNSSIRPWAKQSAIAKLPSHLHAALVGLTDTELREMGHMSDEPAQAGEENDARDYKYSATCRSDAIQATHEDDPRVSHLNGTQLDPCLAEGILEEPILDHESSGEHKASMVEQLPPAEARSHGRGRHLGISNRVNIGLSIRAWGSRRPRLLDDGRQWPERPSPSVERSEVASPTPSSPSSEKRSAKRVVDDAVFDYIPVHGTGFSAYSGEAGVKAFSEAWSAAVAKMKPSSQALSSSSRQRPSLKVSAEHGLAGDSACEAPSVPALHSSTFDSRGQNSRDVSIPCAPRRRRQSQPPRRRGQISRAQALQDPDRNLSYGATQGLAYDDESSCTADFSGNLQGKWQSPDQPIETPSELAQDWSSSNFRRSPLPISEHDIRLCYMHPETSASRFAGTAPVEGYREEASACDADSSCIPDDSCNSQVTSIVVQNLPSDFGQETLLTELRFLGLSGSFNFVYLPLDPATSMNIGVAFLNFRSPEETEHARHVLEGHVWQYCNESVEERTTRPQATVGTAVIQGLEDNVMHYCLHAADAARANNAPLVFPSPGIVMTASWELLDPNSECALVHWDSTDGLREHCVMSEKLSAFNPWVEMHATGGAPGLVPMQVGQLDIVSEVHQAPLYLPKTLQGNSVLISVGMGMWRADHRDIFTDTPGLGYRLAKSLDARIGAHHFLKWGETIHGIDVGDDWVQVVPEQGSFDSMLGCSEYECRRLDAGVPIGNHAWCTREDDWLAHGNWCTDVESSAVVDQDADKESPADKETLVDIAKPILTESIEKSPTQSIDDCPVVADCDAVDSTTTPSRVKRADSSQRQSAEVSLEVSLEEKQSRPDSSSDAPPLGLEWPTLSQKPTLASRSGTVSHNPVPKRKIATAKSSTTRSSKASEKQNSPLQAGGA